MKINTKLLKIADMLKNYEIILDNDATIVDNDNELSAVIDDYDITYYRNNVYNHNYDTVEIDMQALANLQMIAEELAKGDEGSFNQCPYYRDGLCYGQKCTPKCYHNGDNSLCEEYRRG